VLPMIKNPRLEVNESGKSLSQLLEAGEIDAITGAQLPDAYGRNPDVQRLFPDFRRVEQDYYRRTGIFPIMHLAVIKRSTYEKNPAIAASLYRAFCESKERALEHMNYLGTLRYMLPWLPADLDEIRELFAGDCWPYGVEPNRRTLEALIGYMVEQSIIAKPVKVDDLFVKVES
jgi:4,5-dihydroxyphthalate decarboxylase